MNFFSTTSSDTELYPRQDPEVLRLHAEVQEARRQAAPAAAAASRLWSQDNCQGSNPSLASDYWPAKRTANETAQALERATVAHTLALDAATQGARAAWDAKIRQEFLDDGASIEAFIAMLEKYERLVGEAQDAGVPNIGNVALTFLTATEVRGRYEYARRALGLN
jgi:hypothetical protein